MWEIPVPYALWFSSSMVLMTWLVLLWLNVIRLWTKYNPYKQWTILLCSVFCLDWNLWLSVTIFHVQFVMFHVSCSIPTFYVLNQLVSLLTWINGVESYDSTQFVIYGDLSKFSLINHSLFLLIVYILMFSPSHPLGRCWNMLPIIFQWIWLV